MERSIFNLDSEQIDLKLGFEINRVESLLLSEAKELRPLGTMANFGEILHKGHQTWVGLDPQILNTPYIELAEMCDQLLPKDGEVVVDLGAGYGRLGIVLHFLYPDVIFKGYELVKERVVEGNRILKKFQVKDGELLEQDLMNPLFRLPKANYYFLYDYGKVEHIRHTLSQLEEMTSHHHFKVIARGKGARSIIEHEHPWLTSLNEVIHQNNYSIYAF